MGKDVIIACDFNSTEQTLSFLDKFGSERPYLKIGMELFYAEGPSIVEILKKRGHKIFLDLKLHDIPNTVKSAMSVLTRYGADMVNIHAAGTKEMMEAAVDGASICNGKRPIIIAVTQLTSTSEERMHSDLLINGTMDEVVAQYAENAKSAGLDGVVCSTHEVRSVKKICGEDFMTVTPGIRLQNDKKNDQVRVATPSYAKQLGSDFIVVGRSITKADDPLAAYNKCLNDFID